MTIEPICEYHDIDLLLQRLFPICRSITGKGLRDSIEILKSHIPVSNHRVPSGTKVFDWQIPKEWNINDAYVKDSSGRKVIDFQKNNLHILNYSVPIHQKVSLSQLKAHLFSLPEYPDWIPYRTSYYRENWGFCIRQNDLDSLAEDTYEVYIDSTLENGHLDYAEFYLPGQTSQEVFISSHCCHPSLANDNLSGMVLATFLAKTLSAQEQLRYSYRFLFIPGTIGAITWLALNEAHTQNIKHGLVVACVGDPGHPHYKKSRQDTAEIDRAVEYVLKKSGDDFEIEDFSPYGYDERQYCSPGFNLPVGCLSRTPHGRYPEYHTSADNLELVKSEYIYETLKLYLEVVETLEQNRVFVSTNPKCEPQLGKRGLYRLFGGNKEDDQFELALLWVLNFSDGQHTLLDIAEKSGIKFSTLQKAAQALIDTGLLLEKN